MLELVTGCFKTEFAGNLQKAAKMELALYGTRFRNDFQNDCKFQKNGPVSAGYLSFK